MTSVEQIPDKQDFQLGNNVDAIQDYTKDNANIGVLASHSALDVADGATEEELPTIAVCEQGREKTYQRYTRIIQETIVLPKFKDILNVDIQNQLNAHNVIFVPNRSLTAYVSVEKIVNNFRVPMFGNKNMLTADSRIEQNDLFKAAGISYPKRYESYEEMDDQLCMVKAMDPVNKIERAFFTAATTDEFLTGLKKRFGDIDEQKIQELMNSGDIWIEQFVLGAQFNFNYFYSPMKKQLEFLGIDRRIQTNLDGILRLPADDQIGRNIPTEYIEIGHESATIRESRLDDVYELGEKFVEASKRLYPPHGIIGPFALQGAVTPNLDIIVYDLSPRMPGSPVLYNSPYSKYFFGYNMTSGRRVAKEIKDALETKRLNEIIT